MANSASNSRNGANGDVKENPQQIFADGKRVEAAVRKSLRNVRILHKKMGVPLVGSRNGKIVSIPPEEIQIDDPPETPTKTG
jgi:hypothetical protein